MKVVKLPVVSDAWRIALDDPSPPTWATDSGWLIAGVKQGDFLLREPSGTVLYVVAHDFHRLYSPCREQSDLELAISFAERHSYSFESNSGKPKSEDGYTLVYTESTTVLTFAHAYGDSDSVWQGEYDEHGTLVACGICTAETAEAYTP